MQKSQYQSIAHTRLLFSVDMSYHKKIQPKVAELYILGEKLAASGRYVKALHAAIARALVELLHLSMETLRKTDAAKFLFCASSKATALPLTTNRAQLAQKCIICERSVYNYVQDLIEIGIIERVEYPTGWLDMPMSNFILHISKKYLCQYDEIAEVAHHQTDQQQTLNKENKTLPLSNTRNYTSKENKDNSSLSGTKTLGMNESGSPLSIGLSGGTGRENEPVNNSKNGVYNHQNTAKFAFSLPKTELFASLGNSEKTSENERLNLQRYVSMLWTQAQNVLYPNLSFSLEVQQQACELLAVQLLTEYQNNQALRASYVAEWHKEHTYLSETAKLKQLAKAIAQAPKHISDPMGASFLLFNRALDIQRENVAKKGYKVSFPTIYFAEFFQKATHYAHIEQRTHALHRAKNESIQYHCVAKHKLTNYMSKALKSYREYGFKRTLETLRADYSAYKKWLQNAIGIDVQEYLTKFINQMCFIYAT